MKPISDKRNRKSDLAKEILARHAVATLPDSMAGRQKLLWALLAAWPRWRHADRVSVMLEYLEQHQACAKIVQNSKSQESESNEDITLKS